MNQGGRLLVVAALLVTGCFEGQPMTECGGDGLGNTGKQGFSCYPNGTCNTGLQCKSSICQVAPDSGAPDLGPDMQRLGILVITEILIDSSIKQDYPGEWFEVYNAGTQSVDLDGWTIGDNDKTNPQTHTIIGQLLVSPGQYLVLGQSKDASKNGGVTVAYAYGLDIGFNNATDELILKDKSGRLVDRVDYAATTATTPGTWTLSEGVALSLKSPALDNNDSSNWCSEKQPWTTPTSTISDDKGTPGKPAGC